MHKETIINEIVQELDVLDQKILLNNLYVKIYIYAKERLIDLKDLINKNQSKDIIYQRSVSLGQFAIKRASEYDELLADRLCSIATHIQSYYSHI